MCKDAQIEKEEELQKVLSQLNEQERDNIDHREELHTLAKQVNIT